MSSKNIDKSFYTKLLERQNVESDLHNKDFRLRCIVCKETYYWIENKEQYISLLQHHIDETKDFKTELSKLRTNLYLPYDTDDMFDKELQVCIFCKKQLKKKKKRCVIM